MVKIIHCNENHGVPYISFIVMQIHFGEKLWLWWISDENCFTKMKIHQYYEKLQLCWKSNKDTAMIVFTWMKVNIFDYESSLWLKFITLDDNSSHYTYYFDEKGSPYHSEKVCLTKYGSIWPFWYFPGWLVGGFAVVVGSGKSRI